MPTLTNEEQTQLDNLLMDIARYKGEEVTAEQRAHITESLFAPGYNKALTDLAILTIHNMLKGE